MPYQANINQILYLSNHAPNRTLHSNTWVPSPNVLPNLVIHYPGYKIERPGDYVAKYYGYDITHVDIVESIYNASQLGHGYAIANFLVDLYQNGLNSISNMNIPMRVRNFDITFDEFKHLIYWVILQEDLNYPRPTQRGIRLPITRYLEGIVSFINPNLLSLEDVRNRTRSKRRPPIAAFNHNEMDVYLRDCLIWINQ